MDEHNTELIFKVGGALWSRLVEEHTSGRKQISNYLLPVNVTFYLILRFD